MKSRRMPFVQIGTLAFRITLDYAEKSLLLSCGCKFGKQGRFLTQIFCVVLSSSQGPKSKSLFCLTGKT